jgi:hypothetical protein
MTGRVIWGRAGAKYSHMLISLFEHASYLSPPTLLIDLGQQAARREQLHTALPLSHDKLFTRE